MTITSRDIKRWQSRDWADRLAFRQSIRARDANGGHWLGSFSGRQWKELLAACNYQCHWCGVTLPAKELTCDHLYPLSLPGARNDIRSVIPACSRCNSMRGNKTPTEFRAYLAQKDKQPMKMLATCERVNNTLLDCMLPKNLRAVIRTRLDDCLTTIIECHGNPDRWLEEREALGKLATLSELLHGDASRLPRAVRAVLLRKADGVEEAA